MNEERFTGKADIYKKYRPTYPKELIEYLYSQVGFSQNSVIADIGSGTGIFSRLLLERESTVYCVEPNEDMRQTAEKDLSEFENFISVNGNDKSTGLQNKSVDFITVAQAFHWFDRQAFKLECQRILKDGGKVVIIWNERDYEREIVQKDYAIRGKYAVGDKKGLGANQGPRKGWIDFFVGGVCEYKTFPNDLILNRETYIGMNLTRSYSPKEEQEPEKYYGFVKEMNELFDVYSVNGILNYPHFTEIYVGNV